MVFGTIFEMLGAITVGARTADTIKNGIIPNSAFRGDASVQMLAFTCALAGAASWVMWCTRHSAHVSSTYSLISSVAGVGVATVGAAQVQWGWNGGKGMGAIFAGLGMAPAISACFGAAIYMLIKTIVLMRGPERSAAWSIWTAPFFFLIAGTICTLSIVYKGSPNLGLNKKSPEYIAAVVMGTGGGLCLLSALFFVPYVHCKVIKRDNTLRAWEFIYGPLLFRRPAPMNTEDQLNIPNFAVVQHDDLPELEADPKANRSSGSEHGSGNIEDEKTANLEQPAGNTAPVLSYSQLMAQGEERLHAKMRANRGPLGWAMRTLHNNPPGPGAIYEINNIRIAAKRLPAQIVCGALYGLHYDIHAAQSGIAGTPEGNRMERVYSYAKKYPNETEYAYSFVQVLTACVASFAHGANDIGAFLPYVASLD
jgi:sodium-dependent phosphate transporter